MGGFAGDALSIPARETRLSRWHPYPAMIPDELATELASLHVTRGCKVLDPFCGSGRLLMAAAAKGADCLGFDVNPLARLLTEAKAAPACLSILRAISSEAKCLRRPTAGIPLKLRYPSKVDWFSEGVLVELAAILDWINGLKLGFSERLVMAAALSGATRDASWMRKSGWKLHRVQPIERARWKASAWDRFVSRLDHYIEHSPRILLTGSTKILGFSCSSVEARDSVAGDQFDVVLTSPPYGDSRTTVQYGGASGLCLDVVTRIEGLGDRYSMGSRIDSSCLGGVHRFSHGSDEPLRRYWAGGARSEATPKVISFLYDFAESCRTISAGLAPGGTAVLVLGRRSVSGFRLKLDHFASDVMATHELQLASVNRRQLRQKRVPTRINRFARSNCAIQRARGSAKTMHEEIVLTFRRPCIAPAKS
jgi:hypothetical protein